MRACIYVRALRGIARGVFMPTAFQLRCGREGDPLRFGLTQHFFRAAFALIFPVVRAVVAEVFDRVVLP